MNDARRRLGLAAAVLVLSLLCPPPRATATYSDAFDGLRTLLEGRRDNDFLDLPLDKDALKQQKAVLRCIARLEEPAADLGADFATFGAVAKALEKAYPGEFTTSVVPTLPDALWTVRGSLITAFEDDLAELRDRIGTLAPSRTKEKAATLHTAASDDSHSGIAGASISAHAKLLVKAWKEWVKAGKLADKGTVLPAPSMYFYVDGAPYPADRIEWSVSDPPGTFQVTGSFTEPGTGNIRNVRIQASGVTGPGTYDLQSNPFSLGYWVVPPSFLTEFWSTDATGGSVTIDALDIAGGESSGSFTFTATGGPSETQVTVTGTFHATWNLTVIPSMQ